MVMQIWCKMVCFCVRQGYHSFGSFFYATCLSTSMWCCQDILKVVVSKQIFDKCTASESKKVLVDYWNELDFTIVWYKCCCQIFGEFWSTNRLYLNKLGLYKIKYLFYGL